MDSSNRIRFDVQLLKLDELLMWLRYPDSKKFNPLDPVPDTFPIGFFITYEDALKQAKSIQAERQATGEDPTNSGPE
jgi:hypothetical protein